MTTNYTNITLYGVTQDEALDWCAANHVNAYVSPTIDDVTVIYENTLAENAAHPTPMEPLLARAAKASADLMATAMVAVVLDDDMFMYVVYLDGEMADNYMSYAGKPPANGKPEKLAELYDVQAELPRIRAALQREQILSATERHTEIMDALNMPPMMIDCGFEYLDEGEKPHGVEDNNDVIYVGDDDDDTSDDE
jgi:hypothetical protein